MESMHIARIASRLALAALLLPACLPAWAIGMDGTSPRLDGASLSLAWGVPFAAMLASIAILPLAAPGFWHHHFGKVAALCAAAFLVPCALAFGWEVAAHELLHTLTQEYVPFVVLLCALFVTAGGVRIKGSLVGTPTTNTAILAAGTLAASVMGTTGASMLLVHPLLRANAWRRRNAHVFVFFIFLVGNIGGALTPLGDPPLFIGFLEGVDFFWVTSRMAAPMLVLALPLLVAFYVIDRIAWRGEENPPAMPAGERLGVEGTANILLLGGIVAVVLLSGTWRPGWGIRIWHSFVEIEDVARTLALAAIVAASWFLTDRDLREHNGFSWAPMAEVAKIFAAIFITIVPLLEIIRAGDRGAAAGILAMVNHGGAPDNVMYFWISGLLSSFLDNAPTYLLFFNLAGGDAQVLMGPLATTLLAISAGSVFMGANTYIGNAPNFMIKAIAEERGVRMPSFFAYMLWSGAFLLPLFVLQGFLFFAR